MAGKEQFKEYLGQVLPQQNFFYRAARAMTGSREGAEHIFAGALRSAWQGGDAQEHASPRAHLLACLREEAMDWLDEHGPGVEVYAGLAEDPATVDSMLEWTCRQSAGLQRMLVLRFGCGCSVRQIARMTGAQAEEVRASLDRAEHELSRALKAEGKPFRPFDTLMMRSLRRAMNREAGESIDLRGVFSGFREEAASQGRRRSPVLKTLRVLCSLLGAALLIFLLWLVAVLLS